MGILNVTPDSFSDGARFLHGHADAFAAGMAMIEAGADLLDIGGESTRPGALAVDPAEEQRRILPAIRALARASAVISVDTRNAATMQAALDAGASLVNDVSALSHDQEAALLLARRGCRVVLMHMRGTPQTMASLTSYIDVVDDVAAELAVRVAHAEAAGIARRNIIIDPGFGFAKTAEQSLDLLSRLGELKALGLPILAGASRKGFVGRYSGGGEPANRLGGSLAAALFAAQQGAAILRVHDVAETVRALRMWNSLAGCDKERDTSGARPGT